MSENVNQQQGESNKDEKKFQAALSYLTALLGGKEIFTPLKLETDEIKLAVQELVKEDKAKLVEDLKNGARALIKEKMEFDASVRKFQKEMEQKVMEEKKKFTVKANDLFKIVKNIQGIEKAYLETIKSTDNPEQPKQDSEEINEEQQ